VFDREGSETIAEALVPGSVADEAMARSSVEKVGNIMMSGFIDGWADFLGATIEHSPPELVHDMGRAIVDPLAAQVGRHQDHAFLIDSEMRTDDIAFGAEIQVLPDEKELRQALDELLVERIFE
jgi:two-component system chemotaxis sensor kinase CheA/chemotaxis protein CheC